MSNGTENENKLLAPEQLETINMRSPVLGSQETAHKFENLASPSQDKFFSNANLSLVNDTAKRHIASPHYSPSFIEFNPNYQTINSGNSHRKQGSKQYYIIPSPNEKSKHINQSPPHFDHPSQRKQSQDTEQQYSERLLVDKKRKDSVQEMKQITEAPKLTRAEKDVIHLKVIFY